MDQPYVNMLADSIGVPDAYLGDVNQQEAGNVMLALTGFRCINVSARLALENLLRSRTRGAQRGFYQHLTIVKSWAEGSPYERPWCLSPDEFAWAAPQIVKGKIPNPAGKDWFERNVSHAYSAIGIVALAGLFFPESAVVAAAGTAARVLGGVAGSVDLAHLIGSTAGPTVTRAYEVEARRRSYSQSI
ncbi:hypothetical protein GCM10011611_26430 [Aliidongia dinghuensis]|uniref:Uncharacterized protein n=1 Tax=Aliidongia dinghuensis TaxID=1867774 RepID=A0A8J2YTJ9_9PROT|nr:hypothetical protein [Aliidongia dinghuensis]GGF19253.1 hypothetical protein GCM10011611_26430 [Aliidongia dinghuensis]